jgi:predicted DCC family thiol-disulfide oxidoreductase YuxK
MTAVRAAWNEFWFKPARATDLAVSRLLFFGGLAIFYSTHAFAEWADVSPTLWEPIWLFDRFQLPVLPANMLRLLHAVWVVALAASGVGLFTHVSLFTTALLGTYLLGLPHNFGQTYHFDAVLVLAFWILAFSRAGDAWSVDSLIKAARHPESGPPRASAEYRWPIQLVLVALSSVFFAAGVAKIQRSNFEWVSSDHIAILLRRVQYHISDADPLVSWGVRIADVPWMAQLLALATVTIETGYPIALFSKRLRLPIVLGGIGLIIGIRLLMGPTFEHFLLINVFWVPWRRVGAWLGERLPRQARIALVYDRSCRVCSARVAVVRRLDLLGRVEFCDASSDSPPTSARLHALHPHVRLANLHAAAEPPTAAGFDAYRAVARRLPLGWVALPLLYLPLIAAPGGARSRTIAERRTRVGCAAPQPGAAAVSRLSALERDARQSQSSAS